MSFVNVNVTNRFMMVCSNCSGNVWFQIKEEILKSVMSNNGGTLLSETTIEGFHEEDSNEDDLYLLHKDSWTCKELTRVAELNEFAWSKEMENTTTNEEYLLKIKELFECVDILTEANDKHSFDLSKFPSQTEAIACIGNRQVILWIYPNGSDISQERIIGYLHKISDMNSELEVKVNVNDSAFSAIKNNFWNHCFAKCSSYFGEISKGSKISTMGYKVKVGANRIKVMTKVGNKYAQLLRLDKAHKNVDYAHVNLPTNMNTALKYDPHLRIPGGDATVQIAQKGANFLQKANKVLLPIAITIDGIRVGCSVYDDVQNSTTRNTVETASSVAGGWGGGFGGASLGAAMGTAVFPGLGSLIGGIVGGITGGVGGSYGGQKLVETIGDHFGYDVIEVKCKLCQKIYKHRKYIKNHDENICEECILKIKIKNIKDEEDENKKKAKQA